MGLLCVESTLLTFCWFRGILLLCELSHLLLKQLPEEMLCLYGTKERTLTVYCIAVRQKGFIVTGKYFSTFENPQDFFFLLNRCEQSRLPTVSMCLHSQRNDQMKCFSGSQAGLSCCFCAVSFGWPALSAFLGQTGEDMRCLSNVNSYCLLYCSLPPTQFTVAQWQGECVSYTEH